MARLPHTERTAARLRIGARAAAIAEHNRRVAAELERAERGETINLSDLMAAREEILADDAKR